MSLHLPRKNARFYLDDENNEVVRVSTVLNVLNKPALVPWASNMEREACTIAALQAFLENQGASAATFMAAMKDTLGSVKAHQEESRKAIEIGTQAHERIEWELRGELQLGRGAEPLISEKALWATMAWQDWRASVSLRPLHVETTLHSRTHQYAGTVDLIAEIDGDNHRRRVVVLDWKTSRSIYPEMFLQNAAYCAAAIEMGICQPPVSGLILRLPKIETDPAFEAVPIPASDQAKHLRAFLAARTLWQWQRDEEKGR